MKRIITIGREFGAGGAASAQRKSKLHKRDVDIL